MGMPERYVSLFSVALLCGGIHKLEGEDSIGYIETILSVSHFLVLF